MTPIPQITAAEAAHYSLSIRTTSGGLAFCITSEGVEGAATPRCIHSGRLEASASAHSVYEIEQSLCGLFEMNVGTDGALRASQLQDFAELVDQVLVANC